VVPAEIAGRTQTNVVITYNAASSPMTLPVSPSAPAGFSADGSGKGTAAILNSDGSLNGPQNPAPRGSEIALFATGEGALVNQPKTGSITPATIPFIVPAAAITVGFGAQSSVPPVFAGEAPGQPQGVLQINVVVPENTPSGAQTITLQVGNAGNSGQQVVAYIK
jgi:uncharacterized protein (TIGR03437 family)